MMMHFTVKKGRRAVVLQGPWSSENTGQSGQGHPGVKWKFNKKKLIQFSSIHFCIAPCLFNFVKR